MIAKRVPRPKGKSDFARLSRYVVDARGPADPTTWESWAQVSDYVLDVAGGGRKVGAVRITNCRTDDDPGAATLEVRNTQARNTRSQADKTYHLVVAFPPGEVPTPAQLRDVEDTLAAAIGLADHQRISALHTDREHLHLHVAINTVHPRTFRNVSPYYDQRRLMEACERLELTHAFIRTNHGADATRVVAREVSEAERAADRDARSGGRGNDDERQDDGRGRGPERGGDPANGGKRAAADEGRADDRGAGEPPRDARTPDAPEAGASVERGPRPPGGRAGDMETHAGRESFKGWVATHAATAVRAAAVAAGEGPAGWQAVHRALAQFDLELKPRGAGFVIVPRTPAAGTVGRAAGQRRVAPLSVKASEIDRALGAGVLTRRFGPFVAPAPEVRATRAEQRYDAAPIAAPGEEHAQDATSERAIGTPRPGEPRETPRERREREARARASARADATPRDSGAAASPRADRGPVRGTEALFTAYQRAREEALAARAAAIAAERVARARAEVRLAAAHRAQREARGQVVYGDRAARRAAFQQLADQKRGDRTGVRRQGAAVRAAVRAAHPLPTWAAFLEDAAARGDPAALAALRQLRAQETERRHRAHTGVRAFEEATGARVTSVVTSDASDPAARADTIRPTDADRTRAVGVGAPDVSAPLAGPAYLLRNGDVRYAVTDGGVVTDRAREVRVDAHTAEAVALAVALAAARFEGQALHVRGSDAFCRDVSELAARQGVVIHVGNAAGRDTRRDEERAAAATRHPQDPRGTPSQVPAQRQEAPPVNGAPDAEDRPLRRTGRRGR